MVEIKNCISQQTMADTAGQAVLFGHTKKTTKQNNKNPDRHEKLGRAKCKQFFL